MDFVSAGKNALLLYVTVCEKVVPRLDKYDDVIEWNFMKIAPPPEMKSWLRPCSHPVRSLYWLSWKTISYSRDRFTLDLKAYCPKIDSTPLTKAEFHSSVTPKIAIPLVQVMKKSCDTVQQKWAHNQYLQTEAVVSPIKPFSDSLHCMLLQGSHKQA